MTPAFRIVMGVVLAIAVGLVWYARSPRRRARRGRTLVSNAQVARVARGHEGSITWGGHRLPRGAETSHFLVAGTTGSGKSLTLNLLMREALSSAQRGSDTRALIYDPKTEVGSTLASLGLHLPVVYLNPFDSRSAQWDMAGDVTSPVTALQVASIFIPEEKGSTNRYFSDTARDLLAELMMSFVASGSPWTLRDVVLGMRSPERIRDVLGSTTRGQELYEMHAADARAFHNVVSTARSRLAPFEPIAALWSRASTKVSLRDWATGEMVLVLGNDDSARAAMDAVNRVLFRRASELALQQPNSKTRRTWFFLDEVREAGALDGLSRLMTKGRSRGCCVALGFQDVLGVKSVYGPEVALEIVGQCSQKALLRMESDATAKWASATVGTYEQVDVLRGESGSLDRSLQRSASEQWRTADVVLPSEFLSIPPTGPTTGLTGYYLTPHLGAFRRTTPLAALLGSSAPTGAVDFDGRPESDQYLEPWGIKDCVRLALSKEAILRMEPECAASFASAPPTQLESSTSWEAA